MVIYSLREGFKKKEKKKLPLVYIVSLLTCLFQADRRWWRAAFLSSALTGRVFSSITVLVMFNMAALGSRYIQKYLSFQPSLGFVFSALISGVMSSDISSCYKVSDRRLTLTRYLLSLPSRLTKAGPTQPCWMSSPLSRTMKSVGLSAG